MDNCRMNQPGWRSNASYMPYRSRQTMPAAYQQDSCRCHRESSRRADSMPLSEMPVAMAYVPWQTFGETFDLCKALQVGTIFPELCLPFCGIRRRCR